MTKSKKKSILKAYWLRYWHCFWKTITTAEVYHNPVTWQSGDTVVSISCACGKVFYEKETCWECNGSGIMLGGFPCKVCQAKGYIDET